MSENLLLYYWSKKPVDPQTQHPSTLNLLKELLELTIEKETY